MTTSFVRRFVTARLALLGLAPLLALAACSPAATSDGAANIRFAVSMTATEAAIAPTVRVQDVRVLSRHVNLQEPIVMGAKGKDVTVTFALRQREGATFAIPADSLEPRAVAAYTYPAHATRAMPPFVAPESPERVRLEDGSSLSSWTDETTGRVMVQAFAADGAWRGAPVAVSPEGMDAFGAPRLATADGRHVVVAFFVSDEERFQLVAASLERSR